MLVAASVMFAVYAWSSWYWIDLIDEGYFIYLGSRVQAGDLPYRDFDSYYTPGIFYLYAWTFDLFGTSVLPVRILMSAVRVLWALLLYRLTRRVAPWPFAVLPFLAVAAVDAAPVFPEPHPSWPAILATLAMIEAVMRHHEGGGRKWIVVAGMLAGVTFDFKQNVGAFSALALGAYLLLREREQTGWLLVAAQAMFALMLVVAVTTLLWPGWSVYLAVAVWLPLVMTLGLLLWSAWTRTRIEGWSEGVLPFMLDALAAGVAFVVVTLAWLVPLATALGVSGVPWGVFVGHVNQGALILPLDPPPPGTRPVLLVGLWLPMLVATLAGWRGLRSPWTLGGALAATVLIVLLPVMPTADAAIVEDPGFYPWLPYLSDELGGLFTYLPSLGAWLGLAMLLTAIVRRAPLQPLAWYLLIGTLSILALYPRVDTVHAMFAGPPLLVVGAWGLARIYRALTLRVPLPARLLVYVSLLVVPIAAVLPHAYWRFVTIVHADPRSPLPPAYVDLGLERAPVRLPEHIATSVRGAVRFIQEGTPPGEPFFTYAVVPLFNFLADRPNPTRFNHFIAGALTPSDLQAVIQDLDRAKPRYILWDHAGVVYFKTDLTNRVLSDYVWGCYEQVASFTPYLILERRCP